MSRYQAEPWLRDLTAFQRRSVEHVINQFYGPARANRFLVADETGLGKTRVAQGVIAQAIEKNQDTVNRFDIVYVCANSDLARQNIRRLNVTGQTEIPFSSRLTLLGEHSHRLNRSKESGGGVNLVSFTPGTSFDMGHSLGQARERAMITIALMGIYDLDAYERTATKRLLQGTVTTLNRFTSQIDWLRSDLGEDGIDPTIVTQYEKLLNAKGSAGLGGRYLALLDKMGRKHSIPPELRRDSLDLVRDLRAALAAASVHTLEPDLVILDEPTNGLDPAGRSAMLELISRLHREQGKSILLSSHLLGDVERVCDSVVILDKGKVLAHGEVAALASSRANSYRLQVSGSAEVCGRLLRERGVRLEALPSKAGAPSQDFIAILPEGAGTKLLFEAFAAGGEGEPGCLLSGLWPHEENLETVFERIVAGEAGGSPND